MQNDRRIILQLVALGRITAAEAERLLIVWNRGREVAWAMAGSFAIALVFMVQLHLGALLPESVVSVVRSLQLVNRLLGGIV